MTRLASDAEIHEPVNNGTAEGLDRRLQRLEQAVAALQDVQIMEDRVVERVVQRIERSPDMLFQNRSNVIVDPSRMLPPRDVTGATGPVEMESAGGPWSIVGVYREIRAILRMLGDYRYRMSWTVRMSLIAAIVICTLSWLLISGLPFVGGLFDRVVLVVAVIVTYRTLSSELHRFQDALAKSRRGRI